MERELESTKRDKIEPSGKYARSVFIKEAGNYSSDKERKKAHFLNVLSKNEQAGKSMEVPRQSIKKRVGKKEKSGMPKRSLLEEAPKGKYASNIILYEEDKEDEAEEPVKQDIQKTVGYTKRVAEIASHSVYINKTESGSKKQEKKRHKNKDEPYKTRNDQTVMHTFRKEGPRQKEHSQTLEETKQQIIRVVSRIKEALKSKKSLYIFITAILLALVILISAIFTAGVSIAEGAGIYLLGVTITEDINMTEAESYFAKKEMLLQEQIDSIMEDYPDYDEYIFDVDEIGHDPFLLMAYLSSMYKGYTIMQIEGELDRIFDSLYELTLREETEERTKWVYDDEKQEWVEESYEVLILYITLKKEDLETVLNGFIATQEEKEMFDIYKDTGGAHQSFSNPFEIKWSEHISSAFGWRVHPISGMEKFHNGIDIALPSGTPVNSCSKGVVILSYYSESAGNYVVVEDESGYRCHYMHLDERNVYEGDKVDYLDVIGTVGNTGNSTGAHLHLGIQNENKDWINPVFVVSDHVS